MTTPTDDNPDLLTVIAHMKAAPGREEELRAALTSLVHPTSQEEGFVNYDLHENVDNPGEFYLYENWHSRDHLDAHFETEHLKDFVARIPDLIDEHGLDLNLLRRIA